MTTPLGGETISTHHPELPAAFPKFVERVSDVSGGGKLFDFSCTSGSCVMSCNIYHHLKHPKTTYTISIYIDTHTEICIYIYISVCVCLCVTLYHTSEYPLIHCMQAAASAHCWFHIMTNLGPLIRNETHLVCLAEGKD